MNTDFPIIAALTPDAPPALPAGAKLIESRIALGLPHVVELLPRWRAVLSLPTGSARTWLELPAGLPILHGAPRLRFQRDTVTRYVAPLVQGEPFEVVEDGRALLRCVILDWALHVGDMRGPGDFGSFLSLGIQAVDAGVSSFGPLAPSDFVIAALPEADRIESRPGKSVSSRYRRLGKEYRFRLREMLQ